MATITKAKNLKQAKSVFGFISKFQEIAAKHNWISHYDKESDSFVVRTQKLSKDVKKKYFGDEFAFYFNNKDQIEGIFVEYFSTNFISHNKNIREEMKDIKMRQTNYKETSTIELKKSELKKIIPALESAMIDSFAKGCVA